MTKIHLFATVGNDIRLLESWLRYYSEFDLDGVFLSLQVRGREDEELAATVEALAGRYGATVGHYHRSPEYRQAERLARLQSTYCGPDDWFVVADLDEFIEFTDSPRSLVDTCHAGHCDFVRGFFLDRLGIHGSLPSLDGLARQSLWDLFPLGCHLTRDIAQATDRKVVLASSRSSVGYGQHSASGSALPIKKGTAIVHHFKWDELAIQRTRYMLWLYAMQGEPWVVERLRTLRYFEGQGASGTEGDPFPPLPVFWPRFRRTARVGVIQGKVLDDSLDVPHVTLKRNRIPRTESLDTLEVPAEGLDAAAVVSLINEHLDGLNTVGMLTDRVYDILQPAGSQYLTLEPWIQYVVQELLSAGYVETVPAS